VTTYDRLRTLAFQLPAEHRLTEDVWRMRFPEEWKQPLRDLQAQQTGRLGEANTFPIRVANAALRATVPDLISISRDAGRAGAAPWLYSEHAVPPGHLLPILHGWVDVAFPKAAQRQAVKARMQPSDLVWNPVSVDLSDWRPGPDGTAAVPAQPDYFTLLPEYLAAHLACLGPRFSFGFDPAPRAFYRALRDPWDRGSEVILWPPFDHARGGAAFSIVLRLTVQTLPLEPRPYVHCEVMLRRWVSHPVGWLPPGNTSVFVRTQVPWLRGGRQASTFQVVPLTWKGGYTWGNDLAPLLAGLSQMSSLPSAVDLCKDPGRYLHAPAPPVLAIDYRETIRPPHTAKPGWGPNDRRLIFDEVVEALHGVLEPCEPLPRVRVRIQVPKRVDWAPRPSRSASGPVGGIQAPTEQQLATRALVAATVGGALTVDVLYEHSQVWREIVNQAVEHLGLTAKPTQGGAGELRWQTPEGFSLITRPRQIGAIGSALDIKDGGRQRDDRFRAAIERRCDEIASVLFPSEGTPAMLVEIAGRDRFPVDGDPKFAIRLGGARSGRVVQFLGHYDPVLDDPKPKRGDAAGAMTQGRLKHRVRQAWRDLLRQLGVNLVQPAFMSRDHQMPEPLNYVGIWLIKAKHGTAHTRYAQHMPVMVWMASDTHEVRAMAPGFAEFLPYRQALLEVAGLDAFGRRGRNDAQVLNWIEQTLEQHVRPVGDVVLFTEAHNIRGTWKWLSNNNLQRDKIAFGVADPIPAGRRQGMRHVHVRTSDEGETPECFGESEGAAGFPEGLWRMGRSGRLFGSTAGKPGTQQNLILSRSKLQAWQTPAMAVADRLGRPSPAAAAWNPSLLEIATIALQDGDSPEVFAALTHELRFLASHFDDATLLPLPLHLADLIEEYVLPMRDAVTGGGDGPTD
jgi:hypothetical protein